MPDNGEDNKFIWVVMAFIALFMYLFEPMADAAYSNNDPHSAAFSVQQTASHPDTGDFDVLDIYWTGCVTFRADQTG